MMTNFTRASVGVLALFGMSIVSSPVTAASEHNGITGHLARFDQLDFDAFSKQDWKLFNEIHCPDVKVVYPDGHETRGIKQHQSDIAQMFVATPDMRVSSHPVSFGSADWASTSPDLRTSSKVIKKGSWTATIGLLEATFTKPMAMMNKTIQPTGNKLKLPMATIARWENGCIAEEQLFWDNAAYLQQLGIQ
ncbi:MAG: ester cyclase [Afipia sp.]